MVHDGKKTVNVIGAGLAGSEAADRLTRFGIPVDLYEMKPHKKSPAHKTDGFAELVCSNSFRSDRIENAVGLLKAEMRELDSLIMRCADATSVPAGGALAVDRNLFSDLVTQKIRENPLITVHHEEVVRIPDGYSIIATGPLTSDALSDEIQKLAPGLHFYDAAAPIVEYGSLDLSRMFRGSRYGRGDDYLNCPMTEEQYFAFYDALIHADSVALHDFENPRVFEGCMPVEIMAKRGPMTLAYGPLKPVGFEHEGQKPFAVVQLRQDNAEGTLYNIVGFQTNLKFGEQRRVFGLIPGLEHAEYARYGVMHRNTFINSPGLLNAYYQFKTRPELFFAGQMTGVEGYVESASSGLVAGICMAQSVLGQEMTEFPSSTALGALSHYVSGYVGSDFQPMNITFGIIDSLPERRMKKVERYHKIAERSLRIVKDLKKNMASGE
ncbi:MAG: methylenetetrahydrofolate--tRNA-(uracil(54)-C(5))-methyltransferase (FADH(2)-oxidizing) TrmFO [Clostridia bacterium]|nr:methylenetetrahydrofolate--tRNA-(uracil(54)-C(5))-methyltransferase (FADH(2)-oxidizing) TrmFO [Clostridia bacterium]MBR0443978.1 methylenetetrahydrofolate--tRNA-(uracil(54)-C(5))-methyltransferase (FADH(2)-oxidizing) TrmFO [Clostridia bacterium]